MKTIDSKRIYRRGLGVGIVLGIFLAVILALAFTVPPSPGAVERPSSGKEVANAIFGVVVGLALGLGVGLGGAATLLALTSSEERDQAREGAPPATFPGMFGNPGGDPFQPYKERIDAEEPKQSPDEDTGPLPTKMPETCPHCQKKLEGEELVAFCYHCGGALA